MSETADATADAPPAACVPVSGFPDVTGYRRGVFVSLFAVWSQHSSSYQRDTIDTDSITLDRVTPFALSPTTISVVGLWWGWCVNPERIHLSPCPFGVWVNNSVQNQVAWAPPTYFTLLRDRRSRLVWLWCGLRSAVCRCRLCSLWQYDGIGDCTDLPWRRRGRTTRFV